MGGWARSGSRDRASQGASMQQEASHVCGRGQIRRGALTLRGRPLSRQTHQIHRQRVRRDGGPQKSCNLPILELQDGKGGDS